jgi:hypothetical protein
MEVTDLEVIRSKKKEFCLYCGGEPHKVQLACPRIAHVEICPEHGVVTGLSFWGDFFDEDPDDAA